MFDLSLFMSYLIVAIALLVGFNGWVAIVAMAAGMLHMEFQMRRKVGEYSILI